MVGLMARDLRLVAHEWIRELEISGLVNWLIVCLGYQENRIAGEWGS